MSVAIGMPGPLELLIIAVILGVPLVFVIFLIWMVVRRQSIDRETRCRKCGHILRGITEPRCPECGERI